MWTIRTLHPKYINIAHRGLPPPTLVHVLVLSICIAIHESGQPQPDQEYCWTGSSSGMHFRHSFSCRNQVDLVQSGFFLTLQHSCVVQPTSPLYLTNLRSFDQTVRMEMHPIWWRPMDYLRYVSQQSARILSQLREATSCGRGLSPMRKSRREDLEFETGDTDSASTSTAATPSPFGAVRLRRGALSTYVDVPSATALRNRFIHVAKTETASDTAPDDDKPKNITSHVLVNHPDSQISALATKHSELESGLFRSARTGPLA
jgi:hypothetical protein